MAVAMHVVHPKLPGVDPLTQFSVGAVAAVSLARKPAEVRHALALGALAGGAPDLDVLIRSDIDPLLGLEYHRHFSHALIVAPAIGAFIALLYRAMFARSMPIQRMLVFGVVATLTHGLLDACTGYGTLLYWPFVDQRVSWDIISIIDPLFTLPLLLLLVAVWIFRRAGLARLGLMHLCLYLSFGLYQGEQAERYARDLAATRGHEPRELTARPSLGNLLLWRLVYRHEDAYYVDAVWTLPGFEQRHYAGAEVKRFGAEEADAIVDPDSVLGRDLERFRFFSQGYLYLHGDASVVAADLRYAMYPDSIVPLWGLSMDPDHDASHGELLYFREMGEGAFMRLWTMIQGRALADKLSSSGMTILD